MQTHTLSKWATLLLDTGKRNNLINFKDTKVGTVEILCPDLATLFTRAEHSAVFEVYDPKTEEEEEETPLAVDTLSKDEYKATYEKKLKRNQILVYNSANKPLTALKNLSKRARSAIEETGVNIAYLAFGFIRWTEHEFSQAVLQAPILLVPVSIERESFTEPFRIKVTDDEMIVNPTFAFKMQSEYNIKLPAFDEEAGLEAYFAELNELCAKLKWSVSRECKLGTFSFLKINMYQDLKDNALKIVDNSCVKTLLGERAQTEVERVPAPDLLALHNVVDADSSQAEAVAWAKQGKSFVLQGPPGTGKSQTITNIIAEQLADGKKVLFVSEKLAALGVVYDKLKQVGLEEFCLELHSHKANKKQVIEELCHTLRLPKSGVSEQAQKELGEKREAQKRLDNYVAELHAVQPVIRKTPYELFEALSACRNAPSIDFVVTNLDKKGDEYLEKAESALRRYVEFTPSIGYDYHDNVWYGYAENDCSYERVAGLKQELAQTVALCTALAESARNVKEKYGVRANDFKDAYSLCAFFDLVKDDTYITPCVLHKPKLDSVLNKVKAMQALAREILACKGKLNAVYDKEIYAMDGDSLYRKLTRQYDGFFSRLFSGEYRRMLAEIRLCKKDGKRLSYKDAVAVAESLRVWREKTNAFAVAEKDLGEALAEGYNGVDTDFEAWSKALQAVAGLHGNAHAPLAHMDKEKFFAERAEFGRIAETYKTAFAEHGERAKKLFERFDLREYDAYSASFTELAEKCSGCLDNIDRLENWCEFNKLLQRVKGLELRAFVDYTIERKIAPEKLVDAFKKAFYAQWTDAVFRASPALASLMRIPHDEAVKLFKEKDRLHFEINKAKIKARLSSERPSLDLIAPGSSVSILLREGEKKRKQKGIRQLLAEIGELALTLKPCFLMSPLSVSTFLNADMQFDTVIFDEASQIFPQDAVGAIYRGKQLIVVGDSKQMPPSNFFNASADTEEDTEEDEITDFESILDLCATAFPQRRLQWHYRSRFEELISFSNKNFYDNDLVTFPSAKGQQSGLGVDYIYVDGTFDRTSKTNLAEAEKITELVFEHIEKYPDRSLGVVAFSISQQGLIDKLIAKRRRQDPSKDAFFRSDKEEPFFVKNLETVQGDERDTILFSVAYAKDAQGKLLLNFGPLNRAGGERRLNVAITRAKYNVRLVSSMHHSDIDLSRTESVGARLLKEYLDYAENGVEALARTAGENPFERRVSALQDEVAEFLRAQGYEVERDVGCSTFKVGLAVKGAGQRDFALAIECDGRDYRASKTARDRDRLRQDILERMGWRFYRVWSTDWQKNKRVEKERLLAVVKQAVLGAPKKSATTTQSFEKEVAETHFDFPKYVTADVDKIRAEAGYNLKKTVLGILQSENPLSEEWLLKRIVHFFDKEKVTVAVRETYERQMFGCEKLGIIRRNGFLYLQGVEIPMLRVPTEGAVPREIVHIEPCELANGIKALLVQNVSAEKEGLFRLLASKLGFARTGEVIAERMEFALGLLEKEIERNGEMLSLKE